MQLSDLGPSIRLCREASSTSKQIKKKGGEKKIRDGPFLVLPTVCNLGLRMTCRIFKTAHYSSGLVLISPCLRVPKIFRGWHGNETLCIVIKFVFGEKREKKKKKITAVVSSVLPAEDKADSHSQPVA